MGTNRYLGPDGTVASGEVLTLAQAAARLHITQKHLRNLMYARKIGAYRGRPVLIPVSEVERLLAERYQPPARIWEG